MPCNFDPADKATFRLSLAVPPGWTVAGNGAPEADDAAFPDTHSWRLDTPHSAYLFGFVAGRLREVARDLAPGMPRLRVLATERTAAIAVTRLLEETPGMIRFFQEASGVPFPSSRYSVAFVGGGAAQELATMSLLGDDYAATWAESPAEDWLAAHELAHQWWGNAATCASWGDFWIQEAFAVFMTAAYKERRWGRPAYEREHRLLQARYDAARAAGGDHALAGGPDAPVGFVPRKLIYSKGPLVLFALRSDLGDAPFWRAVGELTRAAVGSVARTADLQRAFERAARRRLAIFDRAVFGAGAP